MYLNDFDILRKVFYNHLAIHENIQQRVDEFKDKYFTAKKIIGVHIRYTDLKNPYEKYYKLLDDFSKNPTNTSIFLATDNPEVEKQIKTKYDNIIMTNKWYPEDQSSLHQNPECPDRFENGVQALVDICLLSQCDYLIYDATSTFAFVAKLLSHIPEENAIDISKYSFRQRLKKVFSWLRQRQFI